MPGTAKVLYAVAVGGCVAAGAAGCGSSPPGRQAVTPATQTTARSAHAAGDPRALALAAYAGMWQAFTVLARTADYQPGPLARYAAGDALSVLTRGLYENHVHGLLLRGSPRLDPRVTAMRPASDPVSAAVTDCADDSRWRQYGTSGQPAAGAPAGRHRIYAGLQLFGTTWRVTYVVVEKTGTC